MGRCDEHRDNRPCSKDRSRSARYVRSIAHAGRIQCEERPDDRHQEDEAGKNEARIHFYFPSLFPFASLSEPNQVWGGHPLIYSNLAAMLDAAGTSKAKLMSCALSRCYAGLTAALKFVMTFAFVGSLTAASSIGFPQNAGKITVSSAVKNATAGFSYLSGMNQEN